MMMTDKALAAKAITQEQADQLESWIDAAVIDPKKPAILPKRFEAIMEICAVYNMQPEGALQ